MLNIQEAIDKALLEEQKSKSGKSRSGKFSPSSFGYCYRRQVYSRRNVQPSNPPDVAALRVFRAGYLFEDYVMSFFPNAKRQVPVEAEHVKGYADLVDGDCVYDVKSQHSRGFWWMKKEGYDVNKEKFNNILQVTSYAVLLNLPKASLIYVSKDDLYSNQFIFSTENWRGEVDKEINTLIEWWKKGDLPPASPRCYRQKDGSYKECEWCMYKDKCGEDK